VIGYTGEEQIAAAGFADCPVKWDLAVPYREIDQALRLLPHMASKPRRKRAK
jgi:hypothetical protein